MLLPLFSDPTARIKVKKGLGISKSGLAAEHAHVSPADTTTSHLSAHVSVSGAGSGDEIATTPLAPLERVDSISGDDELPDFSDEDLPPPSSADSTSSHGLALETDTTQAPKLQVPNESGDSAGTLPDVHLEELNKLKSDLEDTRAKLDKQSQTSWELKRQVSELTEQIFMLKLGQATSGVAQSSPVSSSLESTLYSSGFSSPSASSSLSPTAGGSIQDEMKQLEAQMKDLGLGEASNAKRLSNSACRPLQLRFNELAKQLQANNNKPVGTRKTQAKSTADTMATSSTRFKKKFF